MFYEIIEARSVRTIGRPFNEMSGSGPLVSICIPTYNRAEMLRQSLQSALDQTFTDFEVIISDNASQDATESVVRGYSDPRIRYVRNAKNLGHRANMNQCLALSRGKYITILFDDDMMMPENVATKVQVLSRDSDLGFVYSKYHLVDGEGRITEYDTMRGHGRERTEDAHETREDILPAMFNTINAPTVVFQRACYQRLGGFTDKLKLVFDYEYWMRIAVYYPVAFLATPLIKWRVHAGTLTNVHLGSDEVQKLKDVIAAKQLILREHGHVLSSDLRKKIWQQVAARIDGHAETMWEENATKAQVRAFLLDMSRSFPRILSERGIWKAFLKSVLNRQAIDVLKRISPS
jgi:hypothetical protein